MQDNKWHKQCRETSTEAFPLAFPRSDPRFSLRLDFSRGRPRPDRPFSSLVEDCEKFARAIRLPVQ